MFDPLLELTTETFVELLSSFDFLRLIPDVYLKYLQYFPLFLVALVSSLLITPIIGHISIKLKIFDNPSHLRATKLNKYDDPGRHIHSKPIPFLGGLAVIIPLVLMILFFLKLSPIVITILIALAILIAAGILDDVYNLPASFQLVAQILASLVIVFSNIDVSFMNNPFNGYLNLEVLKYSSTFLGFPISLIFPGDLLIIPWIILCTNAIKWIAGSDGLMETNSSIAFLLMFILGVRNESALIPAISIICAGSILGFLFYNFPPAKIFTGGTGKSVYGFLIATLALVNGAKIASTIIILALPIIDALFTLYIRYKVHKPKNPLDLLKINDKSHLHHQLLELGLSQKMVLLVESSVVLFAGSLAIFTTGANKFLALIVIIMLLTSSISLLHIRNKNKKPIKRVTEEDSPESKYSY